ncbi:hypothetical protein IV203_033362 [Nitzschia inconspicua]|uniref:Retroviral polymerase SH3-like domain-containing protein n=1 Tax=Nitzschia inconspicua TaxID=303405 RepID=A0A9K3KM32_9STRA|nr:hypothetical protein IV203_033362 [Nitzschia inconspicua]
MSPRRNNKKKNKKKTNNNKKNKHKKTKTIPSVRRHRPSKSTRAFLREAKPSLRPYVPTASEIDAFLTNIDVLHHYRVVKHLTCDSSASHMPTFKRIRAHVHLLASYTNKPPAKPPSGSYLFQFTANKAPRPEETAVILDTGASCSVTPHLSDFVSDIVPAKFTELNSLDSSIQVHGQGTVEWTVQDMDGNVRIIRTTALYVPSGNIRLFSPQTYFQEHESGSLTCCRHHLSFTLADGFTLRFPWNDGSNLPVMLTPELCQQPSPTQLSLHRSDLIFNVNVEPKKSVLHDTNLNLTGSQKELLLWHHRLGHVAMKTIQSPLACPHDKSKPILQATRPRVTTCEPPRCEACQYAKQKRRLPSTQISRPISEREGGISRDVLDPGQLVSCDLYQSTVRGRLQHTKGHESDDMKLCGGTIFYDIASQFVFLRHQSNLTGAMAVQSKHSLENFASEFGIKIKEYLSDNHPLRSHEFVQDCLNQKQKQKFSGVGAHHQNRVERANQTIFNWSRALMLHYILHWPQQAQLDLWPFAVNYAVWLWNHLPDIQTRLSPIEVFTSTTFPDHDHLQRTRVFGCPVYVLDPKLQDAKKLPKWQKRSWQGIFLGFSPDHHETVALVLNPETGSITPQYHIIFDEKFSTVSCDLVHDDNLAAWDTLLDNGYDRNYTVELPEPSIDDSPKWELPPDIDHSLFRPTTPITEKTTKTEAPTVDASSNTDPEDDDRDTTVTFDLPSNDPQPRRSNRDRKPNRRYTEDYVTYSRVNLSSGLSKQTKFEYGHKLPRVQGEVLNNQRLATLNEEQPSSNMSHWILWSFPY